MASTPSRLVRGLAALTLAWVSTAPASAAPIFSKSTAEAADECGRTVSFNWIWPESGDDSTPEYSDPEGAPWRILRLYDLRGAPKRAVNAEILHAIGCEPGEGANTRKINLGTDHIARSGTRAGGAQVTHDAGGGTHQDIAKMKVVIKEAGSHDPDGVIDFTMKHYGKPIDFVASYTNDSRNAVTVQFFSSYVIKVKHANGETEELIRSFAESAAPELVLPLGTKTPKIPAALSDERKEMVKRALGATEIVSATLADYDVTVTGSPRSGTTLAFLGERDGVFSELDLGAATDLWVGNERFIVPSLADDVLDLFIAVDLTQWLSFPTPFSFGDLFTFDAGLSDLLPGFLVSTSPITLVPGLGFVTDNPLTGVAHVRGTIDGRTAPEPSTLLLMGAAVAAFAYRRSRRYQLPTSNPSLPTSTDSPHQP